jgi:hypothetical protein
VGDGSSHRLVLDLSILVKLLGHTSTESALAGFLVDAGITRLPNPMRAEKLSAAQRSVADRRLGLTLEFAARLRFGVADTVVGDGALVLTGFSCALPAPAFDEPAVLLVYPFGLALAGTRSSVHTLLGAPVFVDTAGDHLFAEDFVVGNVALSFRYDTRGRYEGFAVSRRVGV